MPSFVVMCLELGRERERVSEWERERETGNSWGAGTIEVFVRNCHGNRDDIS